MSPAVLAVSFPWGRYHATPWDRNVNEAAVEWPPSPWRLLRALFSTWRSRAPHLDDEVVLGLLDLLAEPPAYLLPEHAEGHSRHYLPDFGRGRDKELDAFVSVDPRSPLLIRWETDLGKAQRSALGELAELLPYLGRAESLCQASLVEGDGGPGGWLRPGAVDPSSDSLRLLAPKRPLDPWSLTARTTDVRASRQLRPPATRWVTYESPAAVTGAVTPRRRRPTPVEALRWAMVTPALPGRKAAVAMADVLRQACLSRFGGPEHRRSKTLAGKDPDGAPLKGHRHAHYLAFRSGTSQAPSGLLDTLVLWAPGSLDDQELEALTRLRQLRGYGFVGDFRPCGLGLEGFGAIADVAPELCGPSRLWETYTPFAPVRHRKARLGWSDYLAAEIDRELAYRAKSPAAGVEPLGGDWLSYRTHRPSGERLGEARRGVGLRLRFSEPVAGPLALGSLSHFGLGLFLPAEGG